MIFRRVELDAVNRARATLDGAAGKSVNVVKVLKALGEQPLATGFLGGDRGEWLRDHLKSRGIESDFVMVSARTRQCITVIDETNGTQTELVEESQPVGAGHYEQLEAIVGTHVKGIRAAVMSGTLTPGGPPDFYFRCTEMANAAGALAIVDTQGAPLIEALRARPGVVKPNRAELAASLGKCLDNEQSVIAAMRQLNEQGAERVVITAGKAPVLAFDGVTFWRIYSPVIQAVNPIGSGDTFTAGLVWRLLQGDDLCQASRWATAAGTANALTTLAGEINPADVERLFEEVRIEKISEATKNN